MIEPGKLYTQREVDILERQGYEFVCVQTLGDPVPVYVVSSFTPPAVEPEQYSQGDERSYLKGDY